MRRFTIFIAFIAIATSIFGQTRLISVNDAKIIADRNAAVLWENVSPGEPIVYYSADDNIVAYRFNYAINKQFPNDSEVLQECTEGLHNGDREAQWGNGNYGNILMSARTDLPVTLEHGLGISSEFAYHGYLQEQAEAHLGSNFSLKRIYYINAVNVWHHYTNGSKEIYVKAHAPAKVGDYEVFQKAISENKFFCETGDYNNLWDQYLYEGKGMSKSADVMIPLHDECCPFYDWSYGCGPTAAAMLLAYWDNRSMYYPYDGYSRLVNYHFERADTHPSGHGGSCEIDSHCPNVMPELATAMNTTASGWTLNTAISPGIQYVANTMNGYSFTCIYYHDYSTTFYFNAVMTEIDSQCPVFIGIHDHFVLGVGYNLDDEEIITHYTHQPWLKTITKAQLLAVWPIIPGGQFGQGIEIISPDGDQDYYGLGSGKTFYAGDVCEISWNHVYAAGSYVKLLYSTNHGVDWTTITGNTPNDGVYDWVTPSGIDSDACRIQILMYSSDGMTVLGADGSYGDFQIYAGGSIYTLGSDVKMTTSYIPDYYQFSNPYNTWCAVGVRPNTTGENWNIKMFSNYLFDTEWASSDYNVPVNFVVLDRHHVSTALRGIKTNRVLGSNMASLEFEGDEETLTVGTSPSYSWPAGDVVEMYDVYLTPGTYAFDLDLVSGSGDLDFGLFGSTDGIYRKDRGAFLAQSTTSGAAVDENFSIAITTADDYGLCVWANDGNSSTYTIEIHDPDPGTWEGDNSVYWADPNNWSFNMLPTASTDVTIPAGTPNNCMLFYGNISCNSLTVSSGAVLNIDGHTLTVNDDMTVDGSIGMLQDNSIINIYGDVKWNAGSTLNPSTNNTYINVYGNWNFNEGANVNPTLGFVDFKGTGANYIRCYDNSCSFNTLRIYKTVGISALSTENLVINGLTYIGSSGTFNNYSDENIFIRGDFNYLGPFDLTGTGASTTYFDGTYQLVQKLSTNNGVFNNVVFSSSTGTNVIYGGLTAQGYIIINQGYFNPGADTVKVGGIWSNIVGTGGFIEGTSRVIFNGGNYHQYCSSETFNILEVNKPLGGAFRIDGTNVECAAYDWTAGAVDVLTGSFTANDLIDDGIFGAFYTNPDGIINLHQPTGFADLNGDLILTGGGEINIYGSGSSWIPYVDDASITMSGGVIDFKSTSLRIDDALPLTTNITGGTIRTIGNFENYRTDFNLSAGTIEMYGSSDANFYQDSPTNFLHDVVINKVNDKGSAYTITPDKRDAGNQTKGTKDNNVDLTSDILVNNTLTVSNGSLTLDGHELTVLGDCDIYGTLNMTNALDILNVGDASYENLVFRNGSFGNLTAGEVNLASWVGVLSGGLLNATTGNTMNFIDGNESGIQVDDLGSVFGHINLVAVDPFRLYSSGGNTVEVDGNFDIQAGGNTINFQDNSMIIHGNFTDDPSSIVYVHNPPVDGGNTKLYAAEGESSTQNIPANKTGSGSKGGIFEIDNGFDLTGLMDVGDGDVIIHGNFETATTGTLNIDGGSVVCDAPGGTDIWYYLYGTFNMTDGLFEVSNNSINFGSSAVTNISGGILRSGEAFYGMYTGTFLPTGGTVELTGTINQTSIYCAGGNYFHDLTINKDPGMSARLINSTIVQNNLTLNSGILDVEDKILSCNGELNINDDGVLYIPDNGTLVMTYNDYIHVNSGGLIEVLGSPGNPATITCSAGHFNFWIESGGTISANYAVFDYIRTNGVLLQPGSLVDPVNSFNNCTFQNGNPGGCFINVNNDQTFTATNVHFPTNTWGSDYNIYKATGSSPVYFHNASGGFAGSEFEYDPNSNVHWTTDTYQVDLEVFLEGPFNSSTTQMNTDLKDLDLIPYTQPFDDNPSADWYYTGTETVGTIPDFAVDWVLVELRDATSVTNALPGRAIGRQAAFVTSNGDVVDLEGLPLLEFNAAVFNDLYVTIWHRNHLGVISANPLINVGGTCSYSFMTAAGQAYGSTSAQVELDPGLWGIFGGDSDGDGEISLLDKIIWMDDTGTSEYSPADFNLDGQVDNKDKNEIWIENNNKSSQIPN